MRVRKHPVRDIPRNFPGEQRQRHGGPVPPYDTLQQTQRGLYEKMGTFQSDGGSRRRPELPPRKGLRKIDEASLEVLHDRGAYFDSETAREVLRDHGCWEDADGCTHFPRTLVESALEAVPAEFVHRGRTPDDDIHMAQD